MMSLLSHPKVLGSTRCVSPRGYRTGETVNMTGEQYKLDSYSQDLEMRNHGATTDSRSWGSPLDIRDRYCQDLGADEAVELAGRMLRHWYRAGE